MSEPILSGDHAEFLQEWADKPLSERPDFPYCSFDANDWADYFCKVNPGFEKGTALSWFSSALMRGYDQGRLDQSKVVTPIEPKPEKRFFLINAYNDAYNDAYVKAELNGLPEFECERAACEGVAQAVLASRSPVSEKCKNVRCEDGRVPEVDGSPERRIIGWTDCPTCKPSPVSEEKLEPKNKETGRDKCRDCDGTGIDPYTGKHDCPACQGTGKALRVSEEKAREVISDLCGVVEAHEIESLSCDRDGETYCECLRKQVQESRKFLRSSSSVTQAPVKDKCDDCENGWVWDEYAHEGRGGEVECLVCSGTRVKP